MQRRSSQLTVGFSPLWLRQPQWDSPIPAEDLTAAFPATSKNYLEVTENTEDVMDCTGEDFLFELVLDRYAGLTLEMDVDPEVLAGLTAFGLGTAANPTGGTNEVQTLEIDATGGQYSLSVMTGANNQTTAAIDFDSTAAEIQAALEALSNVAPGDIVVADGAGAGEFTLSFANNLAKQDVNLVVVNTWALTGGSASVAVTTPGIGQTHNINRMVTYSMPLMTLYIGFRGSDKQPVIFKNVAVNSLRVRSSNRNKITATVTLIGSGDLQYATGYTMPACYDILPLRFGDSQVMIGGVDYSAAAQNREWEFFFENNITPQFDGAGIDITRLERASARTAGFNIYTLGEPGDPLYLMAENKITLPVSIRVGPVGRNVKYEATQGYLKLNPERIRFSGDPEESEISKQVRFKRVGGDSSTPIRASAQTALNQAYMTPA